MTKLEKEALQKMLRLTKIPSVSRKLVDKLDSADFKLGWDKAHEKFAETIAFITARTPDLKRYLRSPEK
jgi:hypothetical protein